MSAFTFQRRSLLAGAGGAALLAGTGALAGCSTGAGPDTNTAAKNTAVTLPTYVPYTGVKPDLPATDKGVDPAFRNFPKERPSAAEKPGNGETLTGMGNIYYAVPPGPDRNSYWAGLNERMGINLKLQMVGNADYTQKFATTIAGNDLPDMLQMRTVANFPALLEKRFTPLDEHLAGDAIKEYPNLANIPTRHWKPSVYNGAIYGIPIPRGAVGAYSFFRQDLFEEAGVPLELKSFAELAETAKALTDPKKRRWAFGGWGQVRNYLLMMNAAPNGWREEGGKLTHQYETEEYKQAITDLIELWKAGVIHPDSFSEQFPFKNYFNAGTVAWNATDGAAGWTQYILDNASNPNFKLGLMPVYAREGGELAPWHQGSGFYSITSLKKQDDPAKLKLILKLLDWLAAPFGTEEYLYRLYGEEGVDHNVNEDGDPVLTKTGTANAVLPIRYLADSPYAIYQPGRPDDADYQHAYETKVLENSITNPTTGLYSNTAAEKNATADKTFNDGLQQIVQGREPFSKVDELIKGWRSGAGDGMRKEYEEQLQQAGGQPG